MYYGELENRESNSDFRLFFSTKWPQIDGNDEELSLIFGIELLATKTQRQKLEDASQIIEPESLKRLLTFSCKKTTNWSVLTRKNPICIKRPLFLTFVYPFENKLIIK